MNHDESITLRMVTPDDTESLLRIYAPYVLCTGVTFEYEVPTEADFRDRITKTVEKYP